VAVVDLKLKDSNGKTIWCALPVDTAGTFTWTRGLPPGSYTYEARIRPDGELVRGAFTVTGAAEQHVEIKVPVPGH
jgi:hypothetical protein